MTGTVLTEDAGGGVRIITLNRPHRLNAIVPELLEDLIAALRGCRSRSRGPRDRADRRRAGVLLRRRPEGIRVTGR